MKRADVLMENGKIVEVGTDLSAPAGTQEVDASGKLVIPGISVCTRIAPSSPRLRWALWVGVEV